VLPALASAGSHATLRAAMNTTEVFLIAMTIIFSLPWLVWRLGRTDDFAPMVVVQILAGIVLGPGVLGAAFPDYDRFVFNPAVVQALNGMAWWAMMLFVCIAGIELDLRQAWEKRRESGITAGLALGVPMLAGAGAGLVLLAASPLWLGTAGRPWQFVLGIGMACAVTALPILILLMEKLDLLRQPLGQRILRYASLDDLAIWGVLALILLDWTRVGRQLAFLAAFALASLLVRRLMQRVPEADRWPLALVWLALCAFGADWSGLHYMVGAFLAGAAPARLIRAWSERRAASGAGHLGDLAPAAVDAHGGQRAAPDAAGVQRQQVGAVAQAQGRPVAEGDGLVLRQPARHVEPGQVAGRGDAAAVLGVELQRAVGRAVADACQRVEHHAPAVVAGQVVVPAGRAVAVHHLHEAGEVRALQHRFHFPGQGQRLPGRPLRHHAGMHQQPAVGPVGQPALAQPVEQGRALRAGQDVVQRVAAVRALPARGHGQQVQVVVAQQAGGGIAQALQALQRGQRRRPAVDQVAQHVQVVAAG